MQNMPTNVKQIFHDAFIDKNIYIVVNFFMERVLRY